MNTFTLPIYMREANNFIGELKSLQEEISSKFTKKPRFVIIEDDSKLLGDFLEKVKPIHCPPLQVSLKTMNCFLNRIITIAENPKCFLRVENNEPSRERYLELWKAWETQQKILINIIKAISLYAKDNIENELVITNPAKEEAILDSNSVNNLKNNLRIFIKRAEAYRDFYEPPFCETDESTTGNKKISRKEEIRKLLAKNHVKILYFLKKPPLASAISKPKNQENETPEFLFNTSKSSSDLQTNAVSLLNRF